MSNSNPKAQSKIFLFLFVQLLSLVGSKVSHVAIGFWIYSQSHSVMSFSLVLLCSFLPNIIGSFVSGPIVDRLQFNKTFGVGDVISAIVMLVTAVFIIYRPQSSLYLYAAIFSVSAVSALQWVSLNAYLPEVLTKENLVRATGWLSTATSMASLFATSLASLIISTVGLKGIFIFDAATYLISAYVVLYLLAADAKTTHNDNKRSMYSDFKAGFKYLKTKDEILALITLFVVLNFFAGINTNLMTPLFLERYSVKYAGYLLGFLGFGSLIAGLAQTWTTKLAKLRHNIPLLMLFVFLEDVLIGYFQAPFIIAFFVFILGVNITLINTSTTLVMQENVETAYRGRLFSITRAVGWMALPLSQLICGFITDNVFVRFFTGFPKSAFLGTTFLIVNSIAVMLFMGYSIWGKKLKFKGSVEIQSQQA